MIIINILLFLFLWFTLCGLWHEMMHMLECLRQGCVSVYTWVEFKPLPTLYYTGIGGYNIRLKCLAGGAYTSLLCFFLVFLVNDLFLRWCFISLGWVQLVYGFYETQRLQVGNRY